MLRWENGTLYVSDQKFLNMTREECEELYEALHNVHVEQIPDAIAEPDADTLRQSEEFEKRWRKDKSLRPSDELVQKLGQLKVADNIAGYSWYISRVMRQPLTILQLQIVGVCSRCTNIVESNAETINCSYVRK